MEVNQLSWRLCRVQGGHRQRCVTGLAFHPVFFGGGKRSLHTHTGAGTGHVVNGSVINPSERVLTWRKTPPMVVTMECLL